MKLRHFDVFGGIFTVIICLLLFLFIVTADDEESGSPSFDFSGLNLSQEVLKHQPTVEKYVQFLETHLLEDLKEKVYYSIKDINRDVCQK